MSDWYENRHLLKSGQIFKTDSGAHVRLKHRTPGDGTDWQVETWYPGNSDADQEIYKNGTWIDDDERLHPSDLCNLIDEKNFKN